MGGGGWGVGGLIIIIIGGLGTSGVTQRMATWRRAAKLLMQWLSHIIQCLHNDDDDEACCRLYPTCHEQAQPAEAQQ
jgi:hypothetical protein